MTSTTRTQRRYDHRLRELVCEAKSVDLAVRHAVPRSTARGWLAATGMPVVTLHVAHHDAIRLRQEVIALRLRVDRLVALLRLMALLLKLSGFSFAKVRLPEGAAKVRLLQAIDRSRSHFTLRAVLRISGLSRTRYHVWSNETPCDLNDRPSCPRSSPQQLTLTEVATIRDMVTSDEYRHVPTGTLARLAQRLGKVFASPSTWRRLVRVHQWRRPCERHGRTRERRRMKKRMQKKGYRLSLFIERMLTISETCRLQFSARVLTT